MHEIAEADVVSALLKWARRAKKKTFIPVLVLMF